MKVKLFFSILIILILSGCSTTPYNKAAKYLENEQYDKAVSAYLKQLDPRKQDGKFTIIYDRDVISGIGKAYFKMEKYATARKVFNMVIGKDPFWGKGQFYLGLTLEKMALEEEALSVYRNFFKISDSDPFKQLMIGRLDFLIRRKVSRNVMSMLEKEDQLDISNFPANSVSVLYFISQSEDPRWRPLQKGLAEMISTDLAISEELTVIERLHLNMLMEELNLNVVGISDKTTAPRLGKLLGAQTLINGSYLITPNEKLTLDAGIFEAVRPDFPFPTSYNGALIQLFKIEKRLVLQIFDYFGVELTEMQRDRLLLSPTHSTEAFLKYCLGLDALDRNDYTNSQKLFTEALSLDPSFKAAKNKLVSKRAWELTHKPALTRVYKDINDYMKTIPRGGPEMMIKPQQGLVSSWKRLQHTSLFQNNGFLPGSDTRGGFVEANAKGAKILPERLGMPVKPGRK